MENIYSLKKNLANVHNSNTFSCGTGDQFYLIEDALNSI